MQNQIVTGIGVFAGIQTLTRVFRKIVQNYTLGQFEKIRMESELEKLGPDGAKLLTILMTGIGDAEKVRSASCDDVLKTDKITGFFLAQKGQQLELAVFAKGESDKQQKYTACLDEFVKLRRKRLN